MFHSKFNIDKTKFEYTAGMQFVWLDADRVESVVTDLNNKTMLIKMHSGEQFRFENKDEGELLEAYYRLTSKFRKNEGAGIPRILRKIALSLTYAKNMRINMND